MNKHWRLETDPEGLGWLHFNLAGSSANLLSQEALEELAGVLDGLEKMKLKGLVILSDKAGGFIAGADVKGFSGQTDQSGISAHIRQVHKLLLRIEDLPYPSLALIHGYCLGGGLELALACTYRLARDDEATRLGFPELRLGLFPGYGGSVRAIERLGALPALQFILGTHSISGRAAQRLGLIDQTAPERQLRAAAMALLANPPTPRQPPLAQRLLNTGPARRVLAPVLAKFTARKVDPRHYPAPFALIEHWKRYGDDRQALLESEAREVSRLLTGETAQNLIRVFFLQDRLKSLAGETGFEPRRVHVIGGGVMGGDIAAWCALRGLTVSLQDRKPAYLTQSIARAHRLFVRKLKAPRPVQAAMDRLMPDPNGYGLCQADLVIEAIYEDVAAKQSLFRMVEQEVRADTLLATNTSSIPLETIGSALKSPERLIGLHFFNPVEKMQLVEVVHGADTDPQLIQRGAAFVRRIDRLPLPVKSMPGFLVNRILMPYLLEAVKLVEEGVPIALIDKAALDFGMPMGPVELADQVGLDICLAVAEKLAPAFALEVPKKLHSLVEENRLGRKSGGGFYTYTQGKKVGESRRPGYHQPPDLTDRLIFSLLNEAVSCLHAGVVKDPDLLDAGVIFGTGFAPFRGGPLHYIVSGGQDKRRQRLETLAQRYGERFLPDPGWDQPLQSAP